MIKHENNTDLYIYSLHPQYLGFLVEFLENEEFYFYQF